MKLLLALCAVVLAINAAKLPHELTGQELVDYINQQGKWTAKLHDRFLGKSEDQLRSALGAHIRPNEAVAENAAPLPASNSALREPELPKNFNAADAWPKCSALIRQIADQSTCGSCWAVSTSGAMQDRMCIASDGQLQEGLSALDVLSCCKNCGYQCQGGYPDKAFDFMRQSGLVSGSNFTAAQGCKPYPLKPCHLEAHAKRPVCPPAPEHPYECHQECQDSFKSFTYNQDKHFAGNYHLFSRKPNEAMRNLMEHGPLTASFMVYEDFFHYEGGVYEYVAGRQLGGHAVRVVGWGEDEQTGTPYWLVANSWHDYWGEKGYFRIKRGTNEVQFEHQMLGALADVTRTLEQRKH